MEKAHRLYVYTGGKPLYPVKCVADSIPELARRLEVNVNRLYTVFSNPKFNVRGYYYVVELTDEEWREIKEIDKKYEC